MPLMSLTRFSYMRFLAFLTWFLVAWYSSQATCHLEKEVTTSIFQEPPRLHMLCCAVPPIEIQEAEVPHEDQDKWMWGCSCLSLVNLISFVFLFEWPVANPQYNVTCEETSLYFFLSTATKMLWLAFVGSAGQVYLHILWKTVLRRKRSRVFAEIFGRVF